VRKIDPGSPIIKKIATYKAQIIQAVSYNRQAPPLEVEEKSRFISAQKSGFQILSGHNTQQFLDGIMKGS
jgi:hypothetical protein